MTSPPQSCYSGRICCMIACIICRNSFFLLRNQHILYIIGVCFDLCTNLVKFAITSFVFVFFSAVIAPATPRGMIIWLGLTVSVLQFDWSNMCVEKH